MKALFNAVAAFGNLAYDVQVEVTKLVIKKAPQWLPPIGESIKEIREGLETPEFRAFISRHKAIDSEMREAVMSDPLAFAQGAALAKAVELEAKALKSTLVGIFGKKSKRVVDEVLSEEGAEELYEELRQKKASGSRFKF